MADEFADDELISFDEIDQNVVQEAQMNLMIDSNKGLEFKTPIMSGLGDPQLALCSDNESDGYTFESEDEDQEEEVHEHAGDELLQPAKVIEEAMRLVELEQTPPKSNGTRKQLQHHIVAFKDLQGEMFPIREDRKVLKRLLKEGSGALIPEGAFVVFHFNAYLDNQDEPFDSSLLRNTPWKARLGRGELIAGLDVALMSMRVNEKSQFLIHFDLAYGALGCPPRVPKKATMMYEITVEDFMDGEVADLMENQNAAADFGTILNAAKKDHEIGVAFFKKQSYKSAMANFRSAVKRLEYCTKVKDEKDAKKQDEELMKLYLNLAVCYNVDSVNEPQRTCVVCQSALKLDPKNAKAHFHYGRALIRLCDFKEAQRHLLLAKEQSPSDETICFELVKLQEKWSKAAEKEKDMARHMINGQKANNAAIEPISVGQIASLTEKLELEDDFEVDLNQRLDKFVKNKRLTRLEFPADLSFTEIQCLSENAHKRNLGFSKTNGIMNNYAIFKP